MPPVGPNDCLPKEFPRRLEEPETRFPRTPYAGSQVSEKTLALGSSVNELLCALAPALANGSTLRACTKGE
jgi:hypothetical protein